MSANALYSTHVSFATVGQALASYQVLCGRHEWRTCCNLKCCSPTIIEPQCDESRFKGDRCTSCSTARVCQPFDITGHGSCLPCCPASAPFALYHFLRPSDLPIYTLYADLFAGLLIVIVPLAFCKINALKFRARWTAFFVVFRGSLVAISFPISIRLELNEFKSSTI